MAKSSRRINRTVIGIICIVLAIVLAILVVPLMTKITIPKTNVLRVKAPMEAGDKFSNDNIEYVLVPTEGVPEGALQDGSLLVGKYATSSLSVGDYIFPSKVSTQIGIDETLANIPDGYVITSFSIDSFVGSVSGKLKAGDIVTILSTKEITLENFETGTTDAFKITYIPDELQYVQILAQTYSNGLDDNKVAPNEDGSKGLPSTITVCVTERQAERLLLLEEQNLHFFLRSRGNDEKAKELLEKQTEILKKIDETSKGLRVSELKSGSLVVDYAGVIDLSSSQTLTNCIVVDDATKMNLSIPSKYFKDGKIHVVGGEDHGTVVNEDTVIFKDDYGSYHIVSEVVFDKNYKHWYENGILKAITNDEYDRLGDVEKAEIDKKIEESKK